VLRLAALKTSSTRFELGVAHQLKPVLMLTHYEAVGLVQQGGELGGRPTTPPAGSWPRAGTPQSRQPQPWDELKEEDAKTRVREDMIKLPLALAEIGFRIRSS
jgi:hypothetical protein